MPKTNVTKKTTGRPPGRPPGPLSAAEREGRRRAGVASGRARSGGRKPSAGRPPVAPTPADQPEGDDAEHDDLLHGMGDARVTKRFQVYLKRLGSGRDWNEVLTIEKARREMSVATAAAVSLEREAGRLVERGDLDRAVAKIRDAWWREAQQIAGLLILRLADLPAEQRARIKVAAEAEVGAAAERVKAAMQ